MKHPGFNPWLQLLMPASCQCKSRKPMVTAQVMSNSQLPVGPGLHFRSGYQPQASIGYYRHFGVSAGNPLIPSSCPSNFKKRGVLTANFATCTFPKCHFQHSTGIKLSLVKFLQPCLFLHVTERKLKILVK